MIRKRLRRFSQDTTSLVTTGVGMGAMSGLGSPSGEITGAMTSKMGMMSNIVAGGTMIGMMNDTAEELTKKRRR